MTRRAAHDGDGANGQVPAEQVRPPQVWVESGLQAARGLVVIPVLMLILSAAAVFVSGTVLLIRAFSQMMRHALPVGRSGLFLVPETFVVGTALIIAGTGFYQLFVSETWMAELRRHLPQWLVIRALADFTARMIPLLALIAVGGFVSAAGGSRSGPGILLLGAAVALGYRGPQRIPAVRQ